MKFWFQSGMADIENQRQSLKMEFENLFTLLGEESNLAISEMFRV